MDYSLCRKEKVKQFIIMEQNRRDRWKYITIIGILVNNIAIKKKKYAWKKKQNTEYERALTTFETLYVTQIRLTRYPFKGYIANSKQTVLSSCAENCIDARRTTVYTMILEGILC